VIAVAVSLAALAVGSWYLRQSYCGLRQLRAETALAWGKLEALYAARDAVLAACFTAGASAARSGVLSSGVMQAIDAAAAARAAGNIAAVSAAEHRLRNARRRLETALRNAAPAPEAAALTLLHSRLATLETAIAAACERYNELVNLSNIRLAGFPGMLFAAGGRLEAALLLDAALDELRPPARLLDPV
jgi:LemA protein